MEDMEGISPVFNGKFGNGLARLMMRITGVDKLSERYGRHEDLSGQEFANAFLKDLNLNYEVQGMEHLQSVLDGPFITISNHPYGGLDGLILIDLFGHLREDYKVMVNKFLSKVKTLNDNFIYVVPKTKSTKGISQESIEGMRKTLEHITEGHPLGIFPSGAVSDFSFRDFCVRDRDWQQSATELIRYLKVPVVPVRFFNRNSNWFYFLGLINWKMRTLRLPREILNKEGKTVKLGIGEVISVEEQMNVPEADFAAMLRSSVYGIVESNKNKRYECHD
jgi:putative hemolysin